MRRYVLALTLLAAVLLTGCEHTMQGFGQDMQQTGKKIEKSVS